MSASKPVITSNGSKAGGPLVRNASAVPHQVSSSQRREDAGGPKRASTKPHIASNSKQDSKESVVTNCEAANGSNIVAKTTAASSSLPGCRRRAVRQTRNTQASQASAEGKRAAQVLMPNAANHEANAQ